MCIFQGTFCNTGIPHNFYGENICSVGANFSYEMKNFEIWGPAFFKHDNSFIATVTNIVSMFWKTIHNLCLLVIDLFDRINKVSDQKSHILKMKLILSLLNLAAITSYCSISALKCYKCSELELSTFCSNTDNSESWEIVDCSSSSCARWNECKYIPKK